MNRFYVTTTLPYVNAEPHIGFGLEITEADVIARYRRLIGDEVVFNTGTDEHGQKIYQKALDAGEDTQAYVDRYAAKFADLQKLLDLTYTNFIRTTDAKHVAAAQEFWRRSVQNGDIYKKLYSVKYCVGCELEKTDSELIDGLCPLHPNRELEIREEENYFFRFSKYQDALLELYRKNPTFVQPAEKMKEIASFVEHGLQDFSVSRLKEKMPWGVPVPEDEDHVMYVWFDALVNYISTLGWPTDTENYAAFWPGIQLAGKDNLRQQSAMWQAMLFSAGLEPSAKILINGFISIGGQKMSKSLGNVIAPTDMVSRYGTDATRYLLLSLGSFSGDIDVTWEKFDTLYTAYLSNGLGNLCSRVAKMSEKAGFSFGDAEIVFDEEYIQYMDSYDLTGALNWTLQHVAQMDSYLAQEQPWKLEGDAQKEVLLTATTYILLIAHHLRPFMPTVAETIWNHFTKESIDALSPLFPRLNT